MFGFKEKKHIMQCRFYVINILTLVEMNSEYQKHQNNIMGWIFTHFDTRSHS